MKYYTQRSGFTLVELLVVITIIGILIALLLPAVQAAREAARRLQCTNNLKQLAQGAIQHESTHKFFPSGGWGWGWTGDPDRGFGRRQGGSWLYNVLPYVEQEDLHDTGMGLTDWSAKKAANGKIMSAPLTILHCPSRRAAILRPYTRLTDNPCYNCTPHQPASSTTPMAAKSDYAGNTGDGLWNADLMQPTSYTEADNPGFGWTMVDNPSDPYYCSGVMYYHSEVAAAAISDGLSCTYLCGEKYMDPTYYETGETWDDNQSAYTGFEWDNMRLTNLNYPPMQDREGLFEPQRFGSIHANGLNMAMCDGSVNTISYAINATIHSRLGNRKDGLPIDGGQY